MTYTYTDLERCGLPLSPRQWGEIQKRVDKGLVQNMKEDKMPFPKLLEILRKEALKRVDLGSHVYVTKVGPDRVRVQDTRSCIYQGPLANYWTQTLRQGDVS